MASAKSLQRAGCVVTVHGYHRERPTNLPDSVLYRDAREVVPESVFRLFASFAQKPAWHRCQFADYFRITLLARHGCGSGGMAWSDSDNLVMPGRTGAIAFRPDDRGLVLASCPQKLLGTHAPTRKECAVAASARPKEWTDHPDGRAHFINSWIQVEHAKHPVIMEAKKRYDALVKAGGKFPRRNTLMHVLRDVVAELGYGPSIRPPMTFSGIPWFGGPLKRLWTGDAETKPTCFGWKVPTPKEMEETAWCVQTHTSKGLDASTTESLTKMDGWIPKRILAELTD